MGEVLEYEAEENSGDIPIERKADINEAHLWTIKSFVVHKFKNMGHKLI